MNVGIRAEAGPNRAIEELPPGGIHAALDRAGENRRPAAFGVRQGIFASLHESFFPLRLSFWLGSDSTIGTMPPSVCATIDL
jgi:hypothetical protein